MHTKVEHASFFKILELTARVSTKHLTLPILQCALLEVKNSTLTITGTNLEIGIESTLPAKEVEPGVVSVSAPILLQIISLITEREIILKTEGDVLVIETKSSRSTLNTVPNDEFPSIPKLKTAGVLVQGKAFAFGIKTAAFAASQSSIKPELGSVFLSQKKEQTLTFVATDSFRLVEKTVPQQHVVLENSVLIPQKNALELARVCELFEENPTLIVNENQCALQFEQVYITSRLTTGTFPDYEQIIPKEYMNQVTLLAGDLQKALKKTNIFLNKFMQLVVAVTKNKLTLTSKGDAGATAEALPATTDGEDITLSFNQRYLQEILPYITDESITIRFAGIGRPIVIENVHDTSLRYLVMPMNK